MNSKLRRHTYDDLTEKLSKANKTLDLYQNAVNQIDDYFEHSMESKKDQKRVHQVLGNLTDALKHT
jgi:conjugal transfer/entry exclusion protein